MNEEFLLQTKSDEKIVDASKKENLIDDALVR